MEWHLESGLAIRLIEVPRRVPALLPGNPEGEFPVQLKQMREYCDELGLPSRGNAAGHMSKTDLSGWKLGPYPPEEDKDKENANFGGSGFGTFVIFLENFGLRG
jgi:iron transport multicopper oxidase